MITKLKKKKFHLKNIFQTASTILGKNINVKFWNGALDGEV